MRKPNKKTLKQKDKTKQKQKQKQTVNVKVNIDQSKRTVQRKPKESTIPSKQSSTNPAPFYHMPPPVIYQQPPLPQQQQPQDGYLLNRIERLLTDNRKSDFPLIQNPITPSTPANQPIYGLAPVSNTSSSLGESIAKQETANRLETIYEQQETPIKNSLLNPIFKNQFFQGNPLGQAVEKERGINQLEWQANQRYLAATQPIGETYPEGNDIIQNDVIQSNEPATLRGQQASEPSESETQPIQPIKEEFVEIDDETPFDPNTLNVFDTVDEGDSPIKIKEKKERLKKGDYHFEAWKYGINPLKENGKQKTIDELKDEINLHNNPLPEKRQVTIEETITTPQKVVEANLNKMSKLELKEYAKSLGISTTKSGKEKNKDVLIEDIKSYEKKLKTPTKEENITTPKSKKKSSTKNNII